MALPVPAHIQPVQLDCQMSNISSYHVFPVLWSRLSAPTSVSPIIKFSPSNHNQQDRRCYPYYDAHPLLFSPLGQADVWWRKGNHAGDAPPLMRGCHSKEQRMVGGADCGTVPTNSTFSEVKNIGT
ncbi:hypothetical protein EV421DRAFT_1735462 [Armillaria borealis]|uniref:Uncharacterized protein n=1 Tax=Armillaria borealis TaxID=47425 RepID=A0AA39JJ39_9AGAR|nr:hypothetical protein EV421DRAFT_1735462 [Armillaria borealis]